MKKLKIEVTDEEYKYLKEFCEDYPDEAKTPEEALKLISEIERIAIRISLGRLCKQCHWFKPKEGEKTKGGRKKGRCSHPAYDGKEVTENDYCEGCREGFWDAMYRRDLLISMKG